MKKQQPKTEREMGLTALITTVIVSLIIIMTAISNVPVAAQYNYDNVNVTTTVNVTNAQPEILNVTVDGSLANFVLNAGNIKTAYCNATIRDFNGFNDIDTVNATFYHVFNASSDPDDRNEHYTNATCTQVANDGQYLANYSCAFDMYYFANNGTWYCNITVNDSKAYQATSVGNGTLDILYALNVTDVIDYGNLSVTDISENITATITNFGNADINVTVLGYGLIEGDGIGLVCSQGTNISVDNQRYSGTITDDWATKTILTSSAVDLGLTLLQQQDELTQVTANTYWQLYVPPNPFGICTGTVRFTATAPAPLV